MAGGQIIFKILIKKKTTSAVNGLRQKDLIFLLI